MELWLFVGLLVGLIRVALPMTGWAIPAAVARVVTVGAILLIAGSLLTLVWQERSVLSSPVAAIQTVLALPAVRLFLIHASLLLIVLIAFVTLLIRPLYRHMQEMHKALVRYVYPRHLTEEQIATIGDYLAEHPAQQIGLQQPPRNEEASAYRADFQRALTRGGWTLGSVGMTENLPEGISIAVESPQEPRDKSNPDPARLLKEAFKQARVKISSSSGRSGKDVTAVSVTLRIGPRRMDDGDLRVRERDLERARKMLESSEDAANP